MDTKLLKATLYSGADPGGGPYVTGTTIQASAASSLVAAFNAGFPHVHVGRRLFTPTDGAWCRYGRCGFLRVYRQWHRNRRKLGVDASMTTSSGVGRQNLDLLVVNGQPASGPQRRRHSSGVHPRQPACNVWRSGLGVTADGALGVRGWTGYQHLPISLIYSDSSGGGTGAMELTFKPPTGSTSASYTLLPPPGRQRRQRCRSAAGMVGTPDRYFESWWPRDFITMISALNPNP